MSTTTTLQLTEDATGYVVAEFVIGTTSDVLAAHGRLLELAKSVSAYAETPREALPVQEQVNAVVLGEADVVRAIGYTLQRKPEPVVVPEAVEAEAHEDNNDESARLGRIEAALQKFAEYLRIQL